MGMNMSEKILARHAGLDLGFCKIKVKHHLLSANDIDLALYQSQLIFFAFNVVHNTIFKVRQLFDGTKVIIVFVITKGFFVF